MRKINLGPNLIKFWAVFSVIGVHFILNTMDHVTVIGLLPEFIYFGYRQLLITCVPLFMLTTGYLNKNQVISKKYYQKLLPILITYLVLSLVSLIFRNYYLAERVPFLQGVFDILNFRASPYNWYINMYLGLFIISPFLNKMVTDISKKQFQWLLFCFGILTILPLSINVYTHSFFGESGMLAPNFWTSLYPITYYLTGLYLRLYPLRARKVLLLSIMTFVALLSVMISMYFSKNGILSNVTKDYGNVLTYLQSIGTFALLIDVQNEKLNQSRFMNFVAGNTLEIYLLSYISDQIVYGKLGGLLLNQSYTDFLYAPVLIVLSFLLAAGLAWIYTLVRRLIRVRAKTA